MKKFTLEFRIAEQDHNVINDILQRNNNVEIDLKGRTSSDCLSEATVQHFLGLTISQLKGFIHAQKINGRGFQESKIVGSAGSIKKTLYREHIAEYIESDYSAFNSCFV